jgi:antitoxin (DNA-binding transcriptional repressor) of toxin-antitoxin stability system
MTTVTLEEAQARLPDLITQLQPGEQVVIVRDGQPVARLLPEAVTKPQPQFGSCKGKLTIVADDEEHLEVFKAYMP